MSVNKRKLKKNVVAARSASIDLSRNGANQQHLFSFITYNAQLFILLAIAFLLYINTFWGEYVLDDLMSITGNRFVQQGFAGIRKIFSTDSLSGFVDSENLLQGGRYRPLALLSFAIEHALWGNNPHLSHLVNILLWVGIAFLLFYLLHNYLFPTQPDLAFLSALIFIIHPIHTEVVANIKSRDELFSFMFLLISTVLVFRYLSRKHQNKKIYAVSLVSYFLALLSKENGVMFIFLLPLMIYFFSPAHSNKIIGLVLPYFGILALFMVIRFAVIGTHPAVSDSLFNNPFLHATLTERLATILFCLLKYLNLLFFPYPQSYDYNFNQISITGFSNPLIWISFFVYTALLCYAIIKFKTRNVIAFGILFYLVSIFIVSNMVVSIGALIGERLLFQPSFGFSIVIAYLITTSAGIIKSNTMRTSLVSFGITGLIVVSGFRVIKRNIDWRKEYSLFLNDVKISPNSATANNAAGSTLAKAAEIELNPEKKKFLYTQSIPYFRKAIEIFNDFPDAYSNAAIACIKIDSLEEAAEQLLRGRNISPHSLKLKKMEESIAYEYYNRGVKESGNGNFLRAGYYFDKAIQHDSTKAQYWFDLGGVSCLNNNFSKGFYALTKCLQIKPDFKEAQIGLEDLKSRGITSGSNNTNISNSANQ